MVNKEQGQRNAMLIYVTLQKDSMALAASAASTTSNASVAIVVQTLQFLLLLYHSFKSHLIPTPQTTMECIRHECISIYIQ